MLRVASANPSHKRHCMNAKRAAYEQTKVLGNTWAFRDTMDQAGIKGPLQSVVAMLVCLFLIVCTGDLKRERQR